MDVSYVSIQTFVTPKEFSTMSTRIVLQSQVLQVVVVISVSFLCESFSTIRTYMVLDACVGLHVLLQDILIMEGISTFSTHIVLRTRVGFQVSIKGS